jgi:hypothetical protein
MKKFSWTRRAKNNIEGSSEGALVDAAPFLEPALTVQRSSVVRVARASLFTAELEEAIELIATERVYRAMLAGLGRRLLNPPASNGDSASG